MPILFSNRKIKTRTSESDRVRYNLKSAYLGEAQGGLKPGYPLYEDTRSYPIRRWYRLIITKITLQVLPPLFVGVDIVSLLCKAFERIFAHDHRGLIYTSVYMFTFF